MGLRILQLNSARLFVGEAAHTLNLTEALRRAGHTVWLGLRRGQFTQQVARERGLEPVGFHFPHRWWPPRDLPDQWRLARLVRRHQIQVIHTHRGKDHWQALLAVRFFHLEIPVVRTRHVVMRLRRHWANRWLARRTAGVIVVSRAVDAEVRASGLFRPSAVHFIPGGLDLERFNPAGRRPEVRAALGLAPDALVAICVARFAAVKAHRDLLAAWALLRRALPQAVLLLVGDGNSRPQLEAQARDLGLGEGVRFLGGRPNEEIPGLLEAADMGTLSSVGSEGFSRAVLEYQALKLPVVATWVGAVPDLVENGVSGRLVPHHDPEALAGALCEVLSAPADQRARWGAAGRQQALSAHSYPAWAAAHEQLYAEILRDWGRD